MQFTAGLFGTSTRREKGGGDGDGGSGGTYLVHGCWQKSTAVTLSSYALAITSSEYEMKLRFTRIEG